jgi:hypothetical protein
VWFKSSATLATDGLHYKLQTRPLVREGKNSSIVITVIRKRRRKGNLVVSVETVMCGLSPPQLWPLTDCTTNYRSVLSSERAPQDEEQSNCPAEERKK